MNREVGIQQLADFIVGNQPTPMPLGMLAVTIDIKEKCHVGRATLLRCLTLSTVVIEATALLKRCQSFLQQSFAGSALA